MREKNAQDLEHVSLCGRKCLTTPKQGTLLMHVYSRDSGKCINEPKNKQTTKRKPALECVYHKQHDYKQTARCCLEDAIWLFVVLPLKNNSHRETVTEISD